MMTEEEKIRLAEILRLEGQGNYRDNERNIGVTIPLGDGNNITLSAQDLKESNTRRQAEMLLEENYKRKQRELALQLGGLGLGYTGLSQKGDYSATGDNFAMQGSWGSPYQKQYRVSYDIPINDNLDVNISGQHGNIGLSESYYDPMQDPYEKENLFKANLRYRF